MSMNTTQSVSLQVVATALLAEGVSTLHTSVWIALAEILLGVIAYTVYEVVPAKTV